MSNKFHLYNTLMQINIPAHKVLFMSGD